jgi:hypothetical protein
MTNYTIRFTPKQMESYTQAVECLRVLSSRSSFYDWIRQDVDLVGSNEKIRKDLLDPILLSVSKSKPKVTEFSREVIVNESIHYLYKYLYDHGEDISDLLVTHNTTMSGRVKKMIKKYIGLTGIYSKEICMFDHTLADLVPNFHDMVSSGQILATDDNNYIINAKHINSCITKMAIALCK